MDAIYELPVAFEVTKASASEVPQGRKLVKKLKAQHKGLIDNCEVLVADRSLSDTKLICQLWNDCDIKPVIDICNMWKDGEPTKFVDGQRNVVYDYAGNVYCHCPAIVRRWPMAALKPTAKR